MILGLSEGRCPENHKLIEILSLKMSKIKAIQQKIEADRWHWKSESSDSINAMIEMASVQNSHCLVKLTLQKNWGRTKQG